MRPCSVIVLKITGEGSTQAGFIEHDDMVETLAPNGTNHPLDIGSLPRRARCRQNFADAQVSYLIDAELGNGKWIAGKPDRLNLLSKTSTWPVWKLVAYLCIRPCRNCLQRSPHCEST